jgi:hypothetical protein
MTHLPMIADTARGLHFAAGVGWCIAHDGALLPISEHPSAALGLLENEYGELRSYTDGAAEPFPYAVCVRADLSQVASAGRSLPQSTRHVARKLLARIPAEGYR